jgi:NAD(P)-dependent dehydrogenase (short-subunit alcohol dehydrogenase family)
MKLEAGKVAVVTGAASGIGIGLALATRFAQGGLNVVLADVEEGALASAADRMRTLGVETLAVPARPRTAGQNSGCKLARGPARLTAHPRTTASGPKAAACRRNWQIRTREQRQVSNHGSWVSRFSPNVRISGTSSVPVP